MLPYRPGRANSRSKYMVNMDIVLLDEQRLIRFLRIE